MDEQDGGEPGGNIRVGFLFRTDRGLAFVDRTGGTSTTPNAVTGRNDKVQLLYSPGRIDPLNAAWTASRKPLAAEFRYRGQTIFVIVNHLNSKGGDSASLRPLPAAGQVVGGAAAPAGAARERLRRPDPRRVQEREDRRPRRHQRLRVLPNVNKLDKRATSYDVVHVNSEFFDQASDHDPQVARFLFDD